MKDKYRETQISPKFKKEIISLPLKIEILYNNVSRNVLKIFELKFKIRMVFYDKFIASFCRICWIIIY